MKRNRMNYNISICLLGLLCYGSTFAGGGFSRVLTGAVVGIAIGGVGFAVLRASASAAVTSGVTAAVGTIAGGRTSTTVVVDGGGNARLRVAVRDRQERLVADVQSEPPRIQLPKPSFGDIATNKTEEQIKASYESAKQKFIVANPLGWNFGSVTLNKSEYYWATDGKTEHLAPKESRGWRISTYRGYSEFSKFIPQSEEERLGMRSFRFEKTPLIWHFSRMRIAEKWYNRAWTDTMQEILVPENEILYISAPAWYTQKRLQEHVETRKTEKTKETARGYFAESMYGMVKAINSAEKFRTLESRQSSEAAVFYYEKAVEALKIVGMFAAEFAAEFVTPGGVENLRKHARGEISDAEYVFNIANDHARDAVITAIGAHFGGSAGGFAGAVIGGGVGALPTAAATATAGAFAGYVYSRAATAAGRTFARTTEFKGNAAKQTQKYEKITRPRIQSTRQDADKYIEGLIGQKGILSKKGVTKDGYEYFRFEGKCEYKGMKFKKGDYISRDTLHHEWELFRGTDSHQGAINPLTGVLDLSKKRANRILKLP